MAKKAKEGMSIDRSRYGYGTVRALDKNGATVSFTGNIENPVAVALFKARLAGVDLAKIAKANKLELKGANPGQERMNLGNQLSGMVRKGTAVMIGDVIVKSMNQKVAMPEGVKAAEKAAAARAAGKQKAAKKAAPKSARGKTRNSARRPKNASSQTDADTTSTVSA